MSKEVKKKDGKENYFDAFSDQIKMIRIRNKISMKLKSSRKKKTLHTRMN